MPDGKHEAVAKATLVSSTFYDVVKYIALVVLPAVNVLYLGLAGYWDWPNTTAVAGTIALVDTFLGALIKQQSGKYQKAVEQETAEKEAERENAVLDGDLIVSEAEGPYVALNVPPHDPGGIANKDEVRFKVKPVD